MRRTGLVELLVDQARRLRDHGHSPAQLAVTGGGDVARAFAETGVRARSVVDDALGRARQERAECEPVLAAIADLLVGWGPDTALDRAARLADLRDALPGRGGKNGLGTAVRAARDALSGGDSPLGAAALMLARPHEKTWRALLVELARRQRAAFHEAGVLDFAELLIRARDLLATDAGFRTREQSRIGALLLDEFQDTNVLQLELTFLLAEARDGAPRATGPGRPARPPARGELSLRGGRPEAVHLRLPGRRRGGLRGAGARRESGGASGGSSASAAGRSRSWSRRSNGILGQILGPNPGLPLGRPLPPPGQDDLQPWRAQHGPIECVERLVAVAEE
jgi:hypothetical protein